MSDGLVLLEQQTPNAGSIILNSAFTTDYDEYLIEGVNLIPDTPLCALRVMFSTDGGATWVASGYKWRYFYPVSTTSTPPIQTHGSNSAGSMTLTDFLINPGDGCSVSIKLWDPLGGVLCSLTSSGQFATVYPFTGCGSLPSHVVNAVKFEFWDQVGFVKNIASGTVRVYGLAK